MSNKRKIINDPVFGFINIPNDFIYQIIQHRYFQRLNRIKQLGLSSFVYPGAQHTRMLHSLGAMHLMNEALRQLRQHGHAISEEEYNGAILAILLHDIGHGPFSHVLENTLVQDISHEELSLMLMEKINTENEKKLDLGLKIFKDEYPKRFLHQLVSGQLDVDRLDYLRRDSFFTGVTEGMIGSARIIKMMNVQNDELVIEGKGIFSIENFLIARRFMYWQVYLHKTSVAAECMLINILKRAKFLAAKGEEFFATPALKFFLYQNIGKDTLSDEIALEQFVALDDADIITAVKTWSTHNDNVLSRLSLYFTNRKLFKTEILTSPASKEKKSDLIGKYKKEFNLSEEEAEYFLFEESVSTRTYNNEDENILILYGDGTTKELSEVSDILNVHLLKKEVEKYYFCSLRI